MKIIINASNILVDGKSFFKRHPCVRDFEFLVNALMLLVAFLLLGDFFREWLREGSSAYVHAVEPIFASFALLAGMICAFVVAKIKGELPELNEFILYGLTLWFTGWVVFMFYASTGTNPVPITWTLVVFDIGVMLMHGIELFRHCEHTKAR